MRGVWPNSKLLLKALWEFSTLKVGFPFLWGIILKLILNKVYHLSELLRLYSCIIAVITKRFSWIQVEVFWVVTL